MSVFRYKAFDRNGLLLEGELDAQSADAALELVRGKGVTPFEVSERKGTDKWWQREMFGQKAPKPSAIASFTRHFAILLEARIPLGESLKIVSEQTSDRSIRRIARNLREEVSKGRSLSDALATSGAMFTDDYLSIVRAGEMSGSLGDVFGELSSLQEQRVALESKIKSALVYPALLGVMACVSVGVIAAVLVPSIAPMFAENGRPPPPFISAVMSVHDNLPGAAAVAGAAVALIAAIYVTIARVSHLRLRCHAAQLKAPFFGALLLQRETARLARTFGTLLKSGVPIMPGFTSAVGVVLNLRLGAALKIAIEDVREGASLAIALGRQNVLPPLAVQMIAVGEESGQLDKLLLRVAVLFEELSTRRIDRLMTLLTPILTIVIAGLVGALIMSIMSAILSINDLATQ